MKLLLTPAQMYALEKRHFAAGMPTIEAMERAASAFVTAFVQETGVTKQNSVCIACGSGNNAGDGYAIARLLHGLGCEVSILAMTLPEQLNGDALINAHRAIKECRLPIFTANMLKELPRPAFWIDALFGIGLNRPMSDFYAPLLQRMAHDRAQGSCIAAVDVPSGLNVDSGRIEGMCVQADLTVTFEYAKTGHFLQDGPDCTGKLTVMPIGFDQFAPEQPALLIESADASIAFPSRKHNSHKGTYGHLLVVAGSLGMAGAAAYTARAALRSGAGLVSIACPMSIVSVLQTIVPAAMCIPLPDEDGALSAAALPALQDALRGKSAVAVGPGLSRRAAPDAVRAVLESGLPAVVDADALNLIARHPDLQALLGPQHVLTPHPGEAARLCAGMQTAVETAAQAATKDNPSFPYQGHPLHDANTLRALNAVVLLKGNATVIHGETIHISASGSPGMATGGSGDVLSGILGALLAAGIEPETAAWCASEIHGLCGEMAEETIPPACMTASDLIDALPQTVTQLTSCRK